MAGLTSRLVFFSSLLKIRKINIDDVLCFSALVEARAFRERHKNNIVVGPRVTHSFGSEGEWKNFFMLIRMFVLSCSGRRHRLNDEYLRYNAVARESDFVHTQRISKVNNVVFPTYIRTRTLFVCIQSSLTLADIFHGF